jgi:hypothetical protein
MATILNKLIEEGPMPEWLTTGIILLIPKKENTETTKNYRQVTCLPTIYKLSHIYHKQTYAKIFG